MSKITKRLYLGVKNSTREIFRAADPNAIRAYGYVIGPFRTRRGAEFMRDHGTNNPHCQSVADAERIALRRMEETKP